MVSSVDIKNEIKNTSVVRRVASASAIGTAAEYYDFFAYGTAAVLFFGHLFFPSDDPLISKLCIQLVEHVFFDKRSDHFFVDLN